ncbi:hypothetical protein E2562_037825 [Oryza meyeriana var. granulata]|uniref:Uncharacterized protein n=1 Tax=Oryza meyeriana var. granulata TaxID=110450 RepID=A0A6G1C1G1_9ORYZ|nr:hypothetical protein E2562_037825 [Oryza meyeriana var. granulata]
MANIMSSSDGFAEDGVRLSTRNDSGREGGAWRRTRSHRRQRGKKRESRSSATAVREAQGLVGSEGYRPIAVR